MDRAGKRVDRRVLRSRRAIIEAFERLLVGQDLERITVSAIAREANIDRKTFYVHFGTIDGLLDAVAEEMVERIVATVDERLAITVPAARPQVALSTFFETLNSVVLSNLALNRRFFESVPTDTLLLRFCRPLGRLFIARGMVPAGMGEELFGYHLTYLLGGIVSIYRAWVLSDGAVPIQDISDAALALTLRGLSSVDAERIA